MLNRFASSNAVTVTLTGSNPKVCHFFFAFVSDTKALMQRRGLVATSSAGRTDTPATEDPMGTPEMGSNSTRTATWTLKGTDKLSNWYALQNYINTEYNLAFSLTWYTNYLKV